MGAHLRHLPRLPALREPVQHVSPPSSISLTESDPGEVLDRAEEKYWDVVDQCYPERRLLHGEVPDVTPHPWNVDFSAPDAPAKGAPGSATAR
jgi:hypothetical protein